MTRFGGEEFVVLLPHTSLDQAVAAAERWRSALGSAPIDPLPEPTTASFGVARLLPGEDGDSLMRRADDALYRAKEEGRNRVVVAEGRAEGEDASSER